MGRHPKHFMQADTTPKNQRLSIAQLAAYDDLLTDLLVDKVYFWTSIKKNRTKYSQSRGFSEKEVCKILFEHIVVAQNVLKAEEELLKLPGIHKFFNSLKSYKEREDFKKHMQKYISIWLPDCPFEVSTTNRYTITQHEASTTARRRIARGDTIKYLCGNLVAMTPKEEKELDLDRRDFSVVKQVRKKISSLFLGPARFSNHDCKANARLCQQGLEGMTIVAMRDIDIGDEITVDYGNHYFNHNNRDCLCATCEDRGRNGWAPEPDNDEDVAEIPSKASTGSSRTSSRQSSTRKRSRDSEGDLAPAEQEGLVTAFKRARTNVQNVKPVLGLTTPPESTEKSSPRSEHGLYDLSGETSDEDDSFLDGTVGFQTNNGSKRAYQSAPQTISPQSFYGSEQHSYQSPSRSQLVASFRRAPATDRSEELAMSWLGGSQPKISYKTHTSLWVNPHGSNDEQASRSKISLVPGDDVPVDDDGVQIFAPTTTAGRSQGDHRGRSNRFGLTPSSSSALSSVPPDFDDGEDEIFMRDRQRPKKGRPRKAFDDLLPSTQAAYMRRQGNLYAGRIAHQVSSSLRNAFSQQRSPSDDDDFNDPDSGPEERIPRKPGDYIRTKALLPVTSARWVDCGTCDNVWVQSDHEIKVECPRCERHSKLYGYRWPKAEKKPGDPERITDHRLIKRVFSMWEKAQRCKKDAGTGEPGTVEANREVSKVPEEEDGKRRLRETRARVNGHGGKQNQESQEIDLKSMEGNIKGFKKGKGWIMVVDTAET